MVGWHHRLNGHEFEQTLGDGDGQGSLACCSPWGPTTVRHHLGTEQLPLDCFKLSDGEGLCFGHRGIPRT